MFRPNLQSVALAVPDIIVTAVLGWGCFSITETDERFLTKNEVIFSVEQCDRDESRINKRVSN